MSTPTVRYSRIVRDGIPVVRASSSIVQGGWTLPVFTVTVISVIMADDSPSVNHPTTAVMDALRLSCQRPEMTWQATPRPLAGGFWAEMWVGDLVGGPEDWPTAVVVRMAPDLAVARRKTCLRTGVAT